MKKTLLICDTPDVKFFLHHALPLCMILPYCNNFMLSNYIQLFNSPQKKYLFDMYPRIGTGPGFGNNIYDNIIDNTMLSAKIFDISTDSIIERIINWINCDYYVYLFFNESKIPGTRFYNSGKFIPHQLFIFGYDIDNESFDILNYADNQKFTVIHVPFNIIKKNFRSSEMEEYLLKSNSLCQYDKFLIELKKIKHDVIENNFNDVETVKNIYTGYKNYLYCNDSSKVNSLNYEMYKNCTWGIEIYKFFREYINGSYISNYGYQCFCGLFEHKKIILKRIEFLKQMNINIKDDLIIMANDMIKEAEILKMMYFKDTLKQCKFVKENYIKHINGIEKLERKLLEILINEIQNNL